MDLSFLLRYRDRTVTVLWPSIFVLLSSDIRLTFFHTFVLTIPIDSSNVVNRSDNVVTQFPLLGRLGRFVSVFDRL